MLSTTSIDWTLCGIVRITPLESPHRDGQFHRTILPWYLETLALRLVIAFVCQAVIFVDSDSCFSRQA